MANNTTSTPLVSVTTVDEGVQFDLTDEAMDLFDDRDGLRFEIGFAYANTDENGRNVLVTEFGAGKVRRSLLVLAKSLPSDEAQSVLDLRNSISTKKA